LQRKLVSEETKSKVTKEKNKRIIFHILAWSVIMCLPIYPAIRFRMGIDFLLSYYTFTAIGALVFYANYLFLIPALFFQKKRSGYYLSVLALVSSLYFVSDFTNEQIFNLISHNGNSDQVISHSRAEMAPAQPPRRRRIPGLIIALPHAHLVGYMSSSLLMIFLSLGLKVLERQSKIEKVHEEMEKAKVDAELAFLKMQINPHFFFNTLNNIYSLSKSNPEDASEAILKLSKMMRYLLYDSEDGDTKLSNEIELLNNYIDLMRLRLEENYNLRVSFPSEYEDINIPPLLFIPFIENAFKHGVNFRKDSYIDILLKASDKTIIFRCLNSVYDSAAEAGLESSGIGLANVRKRLDLLFPGKYNLNLIRTETDFEVLLKIDVNQ
jgi:two-component system, LytTR family, sensor kinase